MKKTIYFIIILLAIMPSIFALSLNVKKTSANDVIVLGLNKPAIYNIQVKNYGPEDNFKFYTFFTPNFFPKGTTHFAEGETKNIRLEVYPPEELKTTGYRTFDYYIQGQDRTEVKQTLTVNVINLEDAFEVGSSEVNSKEKTLTVYIHNKVNKKFENISVEFSSPFFDTTKQVTLEPYQKNEFSIELEPENFKKLMAGFYTMKVNIKAEDVKAELESPIKFIENNILTESKKDYGFLINTKIITKTNEGNVISTSETVIKKSVLSRLFTTFNPEPNSVDRQGFNVFYTWNQEIKPGEKSEIKVTTNWIFPVIVLILLVMIAALTRYYSNRNLVLRKRVSFVRAKGGEFALKVSVLISAKKYLERVNITERLPPLVKLHERFGTEKPSRIDEKNKRIEWRFDKLEEGETRIISYILYSKIGVVGKFALPRTSALFERDGKILERNSNRTYFVIEQNSQKREE